MRPPAKTIFALLFCLIFSPCVFARYDVDFASEMGVRWASPFDADDASFDQKDFLDEERLIISSADFSIPGRGKGSDLALMFMRSYNNQNQKKGVLGYNWNTNLDISLKWTGVPGGDSFGWTPGSASTAVALAFSDESGFEFTFYSLNNTTPRLWTPLSKPNPHTASETPTHFIVQKKYGTQYFFNKANNRLLEYIQDRNGNRVYYVRDGSGKVNALQDSSGRQILFTYDASANLIQAKDPLNRTWNYAYNGVNRLFSVTNPKGEITQFDFANYDVHNITRVTKPGGNTYEAVYNIDDRVTDFKRDGQAVWRKIYYDGSAYMLITNPVGMSIVRFVAADKQIRLTDSFGGQIDTLDSNKYLWKYQDRFGRLTTMNRDVKGNVTSMVNAKGQTTTSVFDPVYSRPSSVQSPLGLAQNFQYDSRGNLTQYTNSEGKTWQFTWDTNGLPLTFNDPNNKTTAYQHDNYGNMTKITDPTGGASEFTYDLAGNLLTSKDARGNITTTQYDMLNRPVKITHSDGSFVSFGYDSNGNRTSVTDENGNTTTTTFNAWDQASSVTDAEGHSQQFVYDAIGRLSQFTDAAGLAYAYAYDTQNRVTQVTFPDANVFRFEYDKQSSSKVSEASGFRPIKKIDPLGNVATHEYNELYALKKTTDALGNFETLSYDALDRLVTFTNKLSQNWNSTYGNGYKVQTQTDPLGNSKSYAYDNAGNVLSFTDEEGKITTFTYDGLNRKKTDNNALGNTLEYTYDLEGNLASEKDANGNITVYAYDNRNRLIAQTDALGHQTQYAYDPAGNRTQLTRPDGGIVAYEYYRDNRLKKIAYPGNMVVTFSYTPNGNLAQTSEWTGITSYTYNNRNLLSEVQKPDGKILRYTYNANGSQTRTELLQGATLLYSIDNTYDTLNRVSKMQDNLGNFVQFQYDVLGRAIQQNASNGMVTTFSHNALDLLTQIKTQNSGNAVLSQLDYSYDKVGNILSETSENGAQKTFAYDSVYRLTQANVPGAGTLQYAYDASGNRISKTEGGSTSQYTYNALNQLTTLLENGVSTAFTYDLNGNLLQSLNPQETVSYQYNPLNLVSSISKSNAGGTNTLSMSYDGQGRRINKAYTGGSSFNYVYDGSAVLLEESSQYSGGKAFYLSAGELFFRVVGTQAEFYSTDVLGSPRKVINAAQSVIRSIDYKPFGETLSGNLGDHHYQYTLNEADFDDIQFAGSGTYNPKLGQYQQSTTRYSTNRPYGANNSDVTKASGLIGADEGLNPRISFNPVESGTGFSHDDPPQDMPAQQAGQKPAAGAGGGEGTSETQGEQTATDLALEAFMPDALDVVLLAVTGGAALGAKIAKAAYKVYKFERAAQIAGKVGKGAANSKVAAALKRGQKAHTERQYPPGFQKEVKLPSGRRMDAYNKDTKEIIELKPNNPNAIRRGEQQVESYVQESNEVYGPGHSGRVETY